MIEKNEAPAGDVCKGAWELGTACGKCVRCLAAPEGQRGVRVPRGASMAPAGDAAMPGRAWEVRWTAGHNQPRDINPWMALTPTEFRANPSRDEFELVRRADAEAALAAMTAERDALLDKMMSMTVVPTIDPTTHDWSGISGFLAHQMILRAKTLAAAGQMMEMWADARTKAKKP